jgi:transcriptional regulator with XRE-family HTH domain
VRQKEKTGMPRRYSPEDLRITVTFLRSLRGWDQKDLAAAAGLSASAISRYESGDIVPSRRALEKVAVAVGLPLRMLSKLLISIRAARAAVASATLPDDQQRMIDAIAGEVSEGASDLLHSATALALGGLPGLAGGPGVSPAPPRAEDRLQAPELWEILRHRTPAERKVLVEDTREFRSWALCELLCAESFKAAAGSADRALELAELALQIAQHAPGPESWRLRLQGYAWAHVGNARRSRGDLPEAEEAFARSAKLWETGADDTGLLDEAQAFGLNASSGVS